MKNTLNHYIRNFQDKHKSIRLYLAVFLVLAAGIFLVVSWKLHHTGISMTADYQCGYTAEHVHTDACYTKTLVCQKEETDGQEGHTHTESCYEEKTTLNCEKEEHVHGQECYDEDGTLICEKKSIHIPKTATIQNGNRSVGKKNRNLFRRIITQKNATRRSLRVRYRSIRIP